MNRNVVKSLILFSVLFVVQSVYSQASPAPSAQIFDSVQIHSVLCLPMISQVTQLAHDGGSMNYKLPVVSESVDTQMLEYLEVVQNKRAELESIEMQTKAISIYSQVANLRPELAKECAEFSKVIMGNCATEKDTTECLNQRGGTAEAQTAAKNFAMILKEQLMNKTELKTVTELLVPLVNKQEAMKSAIAQFLANNYIKIIIVAWIFIIVMFVFGLRRLRQ